MPDFCFETTAINKGLRIVAGVDEAGRGPFAGPVSAAAVILDPERIPHGLNDSKKLSPKARQHLFHNIQKTCVVSVASASVSEIDRLNILQATHLAMRRAIAGLPVAIDLALIDGNSMPAALSCAAQCIVKGDGKSQSIAAASIVAKVTRDREMQRLARDFPGYGWETNAGYGTKAHIEALKTLGVTPHHRRSFKPIHNILYQQI